MSKKPYDQAYLEGLSTAELEALMEKETGKPEMDHAAVAQLLHTLVDRGQPEIHKTPEIMAAWEEFLQTQSRCAEPASARKPRRTWRVAAVAAAICLMLGVIIPLAPKASGAFGLIASWTDKYFTINGESETVVTVPEDYQFRSDNPDLLKVYEEMEKSFGPQLVVPTWLPDGCRMNELNTSRQEVFATVWASLPNDSDWFFISFFQDDKNQFPKYTKDDMKVIVYEAGGIKHYIMSNAGVWVAVWVTNNIECTIVTTSSKETLCMIIDSIYCEVE